MSVCMYGHLNKGGNINIKTTTLGCPVQFHMAAVISLIKHKMKIPLFKSEVISTYELVFYQMNKITIYISKLYKSV